jgi:Uma2 family endonuclease
MTVKSADRSLSFEEYVKYDDGTDNYYELVLGKLEIMNPPSVRHFLIAKFLEQLFEQEIKRKNLNWICFREAGIRTGWQKSRLPDLMIVERYSAMELLDSSAIFQTIPPLIVEIVNPESAVRDYRYKRSEYAALEVPEYWIIDPKINQVTILILNQGLYEETVFTEQEKLTSPTFSELSLTVKQLLSIK